MDRPKKILPWLPKDERLNPFYKGIVDFVDEFTKDASKKYSYSKEILDPCVGYIKVNSWEIAMLDTMLFQRLRKITQLGLANLVYPSLNYNRFEHTIGTLGRLNQVLTKLKENDTRLKEKVNRRRNDITVIDRYEIAIRIAALFHDVGHCLFSHLSEFAINDLQGNEQGYTDGESLPTNYYPSVKTIIKIFNEEFTRKKEELKIFEIFSITILGTEKIAELIFNNFPENDKYGPVNMPRTIKNVKNEKGILHQAANFIAGLPANDEPETVFLAQLMSSGLDVDKLDYMSREEHFSGIKIEMDLQRIFNKINIFPKSRSELATPLKKYTDFIEHSPDDTRNYIVLGVDKGGQYAYEEFCIARLSLYEKIYLHKKVRAAESYMKKQIKTFIGLERAYNQAHKWLYLPESIIETPSEFTKIISAQGNLFNENIEYTTKKGKLDLYFIDIFKRQIPDRAFGFGPSNSKTDSPINETLITEEKVKDIKSVRLWEFLLLQEQKELELSVIEEAKEIAEEIKDINKEKNEYDFLPKSEEDWKNIEKTLVFDIPKPDRVKLNPQTLHFEDMGAFDSVNWTIPIENIHISYLLHRILAYVYVTHRFVPLITLACERMFYDYELTEDKKNKDKKNKDKKNKDKKPKEVRFIYDQTQAISKENQHKIREIKKELVSAGFYEEYPQLKSLCKDLTTANAFELIETVVRKLSYLECCTPPSKLDVEKFLNQFDEELQLSVLHLISNIEVISPQQKEILPKKIKEIRDKLSNARIAVLPLGSYFNSSTTIYKHLKDTLREQNIKALNFNDKDIGTEINNYEYILLMDDNINSGIQCFNIMMRYLGYDENKIDENKRKQLWLKFDDNAECPNPPANISENIRNKKFEFIFVTGHEKSKEQLSSYLADYCQLNRENFNIQVIYELKDDDKISDPGNLKYSDTKFGRLKKNLRNSITPEQMEKIIRKFEEIGRQVVKEKGVCKDCGQKEADHALGYHNRENLVIFVNSIPTMTFTALWCEGKYINEKEKKEESWNPLIKRK
jgi:HD superfamily phosphohydrolase